MAGQLVAYLLHGKAGEPMATEFVPVKRDDKKDHHSLGKRVPTEYFVQWDGRWRRVYATRHRWLPTRRFIGKSLDEGIRVQIDEIK